MLLLFLDHMLSYFVLLGMNIILLFSRCRQYDVDIKPTQWPVIYSSEYNIGFCGLEKLHPFDAGKWGRIFLFLKGKRVIVSVYVCI